MTAPTVPASVNLPLIASADFVEVKPPDDTTLTEVLRLRAENEALHRRAAAKAARLARVTNHEDSLPVLIDYNPALAATFEDIAGLMVKSGIAEDADDVLEARNFARLFGLKVQASLKPDPKARGIGRHVFLRSDVERCILLVKSARITFGA